MEKCHIVAEASIEGTEQYSREMYDEYVERRKYLIDGVNRIHGTTLEPIESVTLYQDGATCAAEMKRMEIRFNEMFVQL